jgi:hypothetical protein
LAVFAALVDLAGGDLAVFSTTGLFASSAPSNSTTGFYRIR